MGKKIARVDAYIERSADFAKPILIHFRQLVHKVCPDVEETWKWAFPHFIYKGMFCHMAAFKSHCAFGFWHKSMRSTIGGGQTSEGMGQLGKITSLADLPKDAVLIRYLKQAKKLNDDGIKAPAKRAASKPVEIPPRLIAALQKSKKARANFEKLSPSHQREYVEWITEAKREETVTKRLATMLEWLAEGKSRNWKYQ